MSSAPRLISAAPNGWSSILLRDDARFVSADDARPLKRVYGGHMRKAGARVRAWRERYGDIALAAALGLIGLLEVSIPGGDDLPVAVLTVVAGSALVTWRRRNPEAVAVAVMVVVAIGELWAGVWSNQAWPFLTLMVLVYTVAAELRGTRMVRGVIVLGVAVTLLTLADEYDENVGDWAFVVIVCFAGPAIIGWLLGGQLRLGRELRVRNAELERQREERAARAVADERARIARELHDVVAHSVSIMVIQAAAARRVMDTAPERAEGAFGSVEATGRAALDEMRRLLGLLRPEGEEPKLSPQLGLARIGEVLERARAAGLEIDLEVSGSPEPLAPAADVAAFRVVQEAVTNVVKHARGAHVLVNVGYGDGVTVAIENDGDGTGSLGVAGGHGLTGLRERVAMQGGSFDAGPTEEGGFAVRAVFPRAAVPA
jgi:signal transduction histidine kinase